MEAVLVTREPTAGLYAQLAFYAIAAGDNSKYEAARKKSLELATSPERPHRHRQGTRRHREAVADAIKAQQKAAEASGGSTDGSAGTTPLKSLPGLGGVNPAGGLGG